MLPDIDEVKRIAEMIKRADELEYKLSSRLCDLIGNPYELTLDECKMLIDKVPSGILRFRLHDRIGQLEKMSSGE